MTTARRQGAGPNRRRLAGVALTVVALVGLGTASAAQLTVQAGVVAAGSAQVADCQGGVPIRVELVSTWDTVPNPDRYTTTGVRLRDVAEACGGQRIRLAVLGTNNTLLEDVPEQVVNRQANGQATIDIGDRATDQIRSVSLVIHS